MTQASSPLPAGAAPPGDPDRHRQLLEAVFNNASVSIFIMDERQHCAYMNPAAERLTGYTLAETQGRSLHDVVHHTRPDGTHYPIEECPIDRAFPERMRVQGEDVFVHRDGSFYPVAYTASPLREADGRTTGTIIEVRPLAAERAAEAAAAAADQRLRDILDTIDEGFITLDRDFTVVSINEAGLRLDGRAREEVLGRTHWDLWPPSAGSAVEATYHRVMTGREPARLRHHYVSDSRDVWLEIRAYPTAGGIAVFYRDVTDAVRAEEARDLLVHELNHRVKNSLATVQSVAVQTLKEGCEPKVRAAFLARLMALSRAHDLLTTENWVGASLGDVALRVLDPFMERDRPGRIQIRGPSVRIPPKAALAFGLAFHELATNAAKYGALSVPAGQVEVSWELEGPHLGLVWRERDGPPVSPPGRRGFGSRLIETGLGHDLNGTVSMIYAPTGLICEVRARPGAAPPGHRGVPPAA